MRRGSRIILATLLLSAAMCSPALAADTLSVFTLDAQPAAGSVTTLAAHAETDATFGGGHIDFKYKPADQDCAATPADDTGVDANGGAVSAVAPGEGKTDVGGQGLQLAVGGWRICGWLTDDTVAAVVAQASTIVQVQPYRGSLVLKVRRVGSLLQFNFTFATSAPTRIFAWLQSGRRACGERTPKGALLLVPTAGRFIGGDGGFGKSVATGQLDEGRWRACARLAGDVGSVGPVSKTFAIRRRA